MLLKGYKTYIKSPMNYIGNKYRMINKLQKIFPEKIDTMVDLFCGGCDVTFNTQANKFIANDINHFVIAIFKTIQLLGIKESLNKIDNYILQWKLSKKNKDSYEYFRKYYNKNKDPLALYTLMCFSFNYQFRFNSNHEYNNPFGNNRSSFTRTMRDNFSALANIINKIIFTSCDFHEFNFNILTKNDFLYADPPYLLTCGSYNDGTRGFKGWQEKDEYDLYTLLSSLDAFGVKFALSNVTHHKGHKNHLLLSWLTKHNYNIHEINLNYNNCNYHIKNRNSETREIVVTNY